MLGAGCALLGALVVGVTVRAGAPPESPADKVMDANRRWSTAGTVTEHTAASSPSLLPVPHDVLHGRQPGLTALLSGVLIDEPIFGVSVKRGSIYDLLNATVQAHGALMWEIQRMRSARYEPTLILRQRRGGAIGHFSAWPTR